MDPMDNTEIESQNMTIFIKPVQRSRNGCIPWLAYDPEIYHPSLDQVTVALGAKNAMRVVHSVWPA